MSAVFRLSGGGLWEPGFSPEQLGLWRIRKAPEGALPPWRDTDDVLTSEGPVHRPTWWVFPPGRWDPSATASTWAAAMRHVEDSLLTALVKQNQAVASMLNHLPEGMQ